MMRNQCSCKRNQGLSLVEIVIAIAMLSIILSIVIGISSQGYRYLRKARMQTIAIFLAQEGMEDAFYPGVDTSYAPQARTAVTGFSSGDLDLHRTITVANTTLLPAVDYTGRLYELSVRVDWHGNTDAFVLKSYKAGY